ncbi:heat shock 70 kDa protein 12A-like [Saccostrea cucullata]|uniref:heat shock 70 kDa protein 12A-like n=1 Tax=Saccostrea cuccullata TaxID=36930 RepID=UPI002ED28284
MSEQDLRDKIRKELALCCVLVKGFPPGTEKKDLKDIFHQKLTRAKEFEDRSLWLFLFEDSEVATDLIKRGCIKTSNLTLHITKCTEHDIPEPWLQLNTPYVVAIDFGTTYSSYAFAIRKEFLKDNEKDLEKIYTVNWNAGRFISNKTPTTLLLNKDQKDVSFGYDAEKTYGEMSEDERENHYYFHRFKMLLYDKDGNLVNIVSI